MEKTTAVYRDGTEPKVLDQIYGTNEDGTQFCGMLNKINDDGTGEIIWIRPAGHKGRGLTELTSGKAVIDLSRANSIDYGGVA